MKPKNKPQKKKFTLIEFFEQDLPESPMQAKMNTSHTNLNIPKEDEKVTFEEMMKEPKDEKLIESFSRLKLFKTNQDKKAEESKFKGQEKKK